MYDHELRELAPTVYFVLIDQVIDEQYIYIGL